MGGNKNINEKTKYGIKGIENENNIMGSRTLSLSWTDNENNLWLFGGEQLNPINNRTELLSDLWRFNISSGIWTWISGEDKPNSQSVHGTIGIGTNFTSPGFFFFFFFIK
jgi:hypothetical protein